MAQILNAGTGLCQPCHDLDLESVFSTQILSWETERTGKWLARLNISTADTSCRLCRFLNVMKVSVPPPVDVEDLKPYEQWIADGRPYNLKLFPADAIFHFAEFPHVNPVLAVLPTWIEGCSSVAGYFIGHGVWGPPKLLTDLLQKSGFIVSVCPASKERMFTGRLLSSSGAGFDVIDERLSYCNERHGTCSISATSRTLGIKLIDCTTNLIVNARTDWKYLALSYVWGKSTSSSHTFSSTLPEHLPKTIEDSMQVVLRLGYQYLWVDKYCIDQQDLAEKHIQVSNMDLIYRNASMTIIAAAGEDASYGLPGVGDTKRNRQPYAKIGTLLLVSSLPNPVYEIGSTKWNSRGWTYQEGLLSKRRLVFTQHQVYFQCSGMHCFESVEMSLDNLHIGEPKRFPDNLKFGCVFPDLSPTSGGGASKGFFDRINEYSDRSLSFESDKLAAVQGVLREFEEHYFPVYHHWGLPLPGWQAQSSSRNWILRYALALLWHFKCPGERRCGFPSWSWVGWKDWKGLSPMFSGYELWEDTWHAAEGLQIGIQTQDEPLITWITCDKLDVNALKSSSSRILIRSQIFSLKEVRQEIRGEKDGFQINWNTAEPTSPCEAILLAKKSGEYSTECFLLVEKVGHHYEQRGTLWAGGYQYYPWYREKLHFVVNTIVLG